MNAAVTLAADYPLLDVFWTTLWIFLWILWFMLLFRIITDVFRDDDLSGWAKAGWMIFVVFLPFLGVFVYLIARGKGMGNRELSAARQSEQAFRSYVQEAAGGGGSTVDQLARLGELKTSGQITEEEFQAAKAKILAS
ncbi:SHOCT domain-containing protein [Streptomyces sp. HUAS MG47]|uniref:SHOCT domain-containing protein n=1 Tax=Streptomyces solicamelliae TaxID=3231716 RepID=UPI0038781E34